jgi:hypothetical protein
MKPKPYYYESINRNSIVVKPKQPLFGWINSIYQDDPVDAADEGTVYLIRERDSIEEIEKWLQKHFDDIFQNELNNWHTDEKDWPRKRTYKQFTEWFEFEIHSMILDLEETVIIKG